VSFRASLGDGTAQQAQQQQQQQRGGGGVPLASPKPLLIKSPVHTARVRTWLKLFPGAKFIYIHRHPLEVFKSAAHMANTYYYHTFLQVLIDHSATEPLNELYIID
jgi:hypothetical protein